MNILEIDDFPSSSCSEETVEANEKCLVCRKKAAGNHYSVPACHGCKSFFRRATVNNVTYPPCKYDRNCFAGPTKTVGPRKCRQCRLQKCYAVGMIAVVSHCNKKIDTALSSPSSSDSELPDLALAPVTTISPSPSHEQHVTGLLHNLTHLDDQVVKFRNSAYNPMIIPNLEELLQTNGRLHYADKYGPMQGWPITQEQFIEQQAVINKIKTEYDAETFHTSSSSAFVPFDKEAYTKKINTKEWLSFDMLTAVEYAKSFPFFNELSTADQLLLAKATTFMNLSITSSYYSYQSKMGVLQMPDGITISGPVGKSAKEVRSFERRLSLRVMAPLIRNLIDKNEYLLLKAIILSNSAVTDLSHHAQNVLNRERHNYSGALLLYSLAKHGTAYGPARYYMILNMIDVLEHHQRDFRDFMLLLDMSVPDRFSNSRKQLQHEILQF